MEGQITSYRRGVRTQKKYQMIVRVEGVNDKKSATSMIGKSVVWTSTGKAKKEIKGTITNIHGNKGGLRVQFETGLPGQSLATKVKIN